MQVLTQRQASDIARQFPFDPQKILTPALLDGLRRVVAKQLRHIELRKSPMRRAHLQQQMGAL